MPVSSALVSQVGLICGVWHVRVQVLLEIGSTTACCHLRVSGLAPAYVYVPMVYVNTCVHVCTLYRVLLFDARILLLVCTCQETTHL